MKGMVNKTSATNSGVKGYPELKIKGNIPVS
jgi:hypothetical protein